MSRISLIALALACSSTLFSSEKDFVVNLKNPEYVDGVVTTNEGGVITAPGMRIQARQIRYINQQQNGEKIQRIWARGDLMMEYQGRFFVGDEIDYDLQTKTGVLRCGRTGVEGWYLGGELINLCSDGSFTIYGAYVTTSSDLSPLWEITSKEVKVNKEMQLSARNVFFEFGKVPVFWVPAFRANLKWLQDSPVSFRIPQWDTSLGPRLSARYRIYSWENFASYFRFDWRLRTGGVGGALEAEYHAPDGRTHFLTQNYAAYDKSFPNQSGNRGYRFQGLFKHIFADECTRFHAQWDRFSSDRMINMFKSPDFEINTQKSTYATLNHLSENGFIDLKFRPRINSFQTMNQELPYSAMGLRPIELWKTGIISENYVSGSYLDYTFANQIDKLLQDRKSGRLETINTLYRPVQAGPVTITPRAGVVGIFYSQSPTRGSTGQLLMSYGGDVTSTLSKWTPAWHHMVTPYCKYLGYTRPQTPVDRYPVFDIDDGYDRLDQLRFGVHQALYTRGSESLLPALSLDLYGYALFGPRAYEDTIPKLFADFEVNRPYWALKGRGIWNVEDQLLDEGNVEFLYTVSPSMALGVEFRHRSKYRFRKAVYDNWVVDFARPIDELLDSPLSDRRNTLLTKVHIRFTPRWNMQFQSFHGWGRKDEPRYNGAKVEFYTMLTTSLQWKITYEYLPNDPFRFSLDLKLIK